MVATDEGGEDVQVVIGGMEPDKDCSIGGSEGEDDGAGKVAAVSGKGGGEGHGEGVQVDKGDWNGDGSFSGRNSGSFMIVDLTAVGWVAWNSLMRSGACISDSSTHESCEGEYPFQRTKYWSFLLRPKHRLFRMVSTSHSGSPSMISGGGSMKLGPCCSVSLYGVKREAWNTS